MKVMKLVYKVILLLGVLQRVLTEPLQASPRMSALESKNQLLQFYAKEINILSRETCVKFKNMSEHILKDQTVHEAKSHLMQEFKRNITQFLETYPTYMRYGLNKQLLIIFSSTTINYFYQKPIASRDSQYILQLISKLGYNKIFDQFERSFMKFALNRFVPKFEELQKQISMNETQQFQKLFKWAQEMKACKVYVCFYNHFNSFDKTILTPKEQLFAYIRQQLKEISIFYGNSAINIARGVSKSIKLQQLNTTVRTRLLYNINEYIRKYESTNDTNQLYSLLPVFYQTVLISFYNNTDLPAKERLLLVNIFDEEGYAQFQLIYYKKFNNFVEQGLFKRFDNFRTSLNQEELLKDKPMLEWFNTFKRLSSYEDRTKAFKDLFAMEKM